MLSPIHLKTDELRPPVVEKMISMDITDDEDPAIGDKIRDISIQKGSKTIPPSLA
jgi:hypothetical protein